MKPTCSEVDVRAHTIFDQKEALTSKTFCNKISSKKVFIIPSTIRCKDLPFYWVSSSQIE